MWDGEKPEGLSSHGRLMEGETVYKRDGGPDPPEEISDSKPRLRPKTISCAPVYSGANASIAYRCSLRNGQQQLGRPC